MVKKAFSFLAFVIVVSAVPAVGAAQQPERMAARALFDEGVALAQEDRWAEALSAFRRSDALVSRASTSYNIANALYRLDRPVDALSELDDHDEMPEVRNDLSARERSQKLRALIEEAVAELRLRVAPSGASVFVDGRPAEADGAERVILVNPGSHVIRVSHEGYEPHRQEVWVDRGGRKTHSIALRVVPSVLAPPPSLTVGTSPISTGPDGPPDSAPVEDDRKRFVKRPGFWVMIGVIAAAGVGAGVAVALTRRDDGPSCGTTGTCATTQGLTVTSF